MKDRTHQDSGSTHIIRYALEMGLLWIDGDGRDKVREALDALDILEAQLSERGAGGVGPLMGQPQEMPDLSALTERGAKAWAGVDAQGLRDGVASAGSEPVAWQGAHDPTDLYYRKPPQADVRPLYTAPQPSPTAQAAESVPAGPKRKDMLWSTAKMQERNDQRIENIVSGLERIKQEHAGQKPQKIDECYGDCPTDPTTCTNPCRFDGRAARAPADSVLEDAALTFTSAHIDYVARYGGRCRDCADESGVCPGSGLPCADSRKAIKHVFDALEYGVKHGFVKSPVAARKQGANHD